MIYVVAVIAGIVGAVVGWFVTGAVTVWIAGLCGMTDFEGARGMFAFLGVGPIGGLVAMIASSWIVLRVGHGRVPLAHALARVAGVLGVIALIVGAGIVIRLWTLDTYTDTLPPTLEFELRIPATLPPPDPSSLRVALHTDKNVGEGRLEERWLPMDDGRTVIAGSVPLDFKTSSRLLVVTVAGQPTRLFKLPLARDPRSSRILGGWIRPDFVDVAGEAQPRRAPVDDPFELRYRVRRAGED